MHRSHHRIIGEGERRNRVEHAERELGRSKYSVINPTQKLLNLIRTGQKVSRDDRTGVA
jgi:hypothetical protein